MKTKTFLNSPLRIMILSLFVAVPSIIGFAQGNCGNPVDCPDGNPSGPFRLKCCQDMGWLGLGTGCFELKRRIWACPMEPGQHPVPTAFEYQVHTGPFEDATCTGDPGGTWTGSCQPTM